MSWSEQSRIDVIAAMKSLELGAAAVRAQLEFGHDLSPDACLEHLQVLKGYLRAAKLAASWDRSE